MDRDRADAEAARGADDAAGDLAAVGDEQRFDHGALRGKCCWKWTKWRVRRVPDTGGCGGEKRTGVCEAGARSAAMRYRHTTGGSV
ncbi:hypothetical protein WR25_03167 [Diploscapter pachys]|uniref:Uncharacterized protein n=1 Tax=Diploscapter pachys TaxID=2018661 RepID=A0A2A2M5C7_9BILA|nr:hypothetical protein WR25_03167 [Diploscapter pachys]